MPLKNTTFQGVNLISVEPDSPIRQSDLKAAAGDIAGVKAHLFDNAETGNINHSGPGRGSVLGIPLVNQYWGRGLGLDAGVQPAELWFPFIIPPQYDTKLFVEMKISGSSLFEDIFFPRVLLRAMGDFTTSAMVNDEEPFRTRPDGDGFIRAALNGVDTGVPMMMFIVINYRNTLGTPLTDFDVIHSVIVRNLRAESNIISVTNPATEPNQVKVYPPAAGNHLEWFDHYEGTFSDALAVNGYQTRTLDQNINGLMESMTGAPAGSNGSYVHTESALINPTRDRFRAFTRKTFANEPIPFIPIMSHNCGGIGNTGKYLVNARVNPFDGNTDSESERQAYAPYFNTAAKQEWSIKLQLPDVPLGKIKYAVLLGTENSFNFAQVNVSAQWVSEIETTPGAPTAVTGATHLGLFTQVLPNFDRDGNGRFRVFFERYGSYICRDYCLLAVSVWVED